MSASSTSRDRHGLGGDQGGGGAAPAMKTCCLSSASNMGCSLASCSSPSSRFRTVLTARTRHADEGGFFLNASFLTGILSVHYVVLGCWPSRDRVHLAECFTFARVLPSPHTPPAITPAHIGSAGMHCCGNAGASSTRPKKTLRTPPVRSL